MAKKISSNIPKCWLAAILIILISDKKHVWHINSCFSYPEILPLNRNWKQSKLPSVLVQWENPSTRHHHSHASGAFCYWTANSWDETWGKTTHKNTAILPRRPDHYHDWYTTLALDVTIGTVSVWSLNWPPTEGRRHSELLPEYC